MAHLGVLEKMKKNQRQPHAAKYWLGNYECGQCETGVVQIHQQINRNHEVTTNVSGCLDCGYEYGLQQASGLKEYTRKDTTWA